MPGLSLNPVKYVLVQDTDKRRGIFSAEGWFWSVRDDGRALTLSAGRYHQGRIPAEWRLCVEQLRRVKRVHIMYPGDSQPRTYTAGSWSAQWDGRDNTLQLFAAPDAR